MPRRRGRRAPARPPTSTAAQRLDQRLGDRAAPGRCRRASRARRAPRPCRGRSRRRSRSRARGRRGPARPSRRTEARRRSGSSGRRARRCGWRRWPRGPPASRAAARSGSPASSITSAPSARRRRREAARLGSGAGDDDAPAVERAALEPGDGTRGARRPGPKSRIAGGTGRRPRLRRRSSAEGADDGRWPGQRAALDSRPRAPPGRGPPAISALADLGRVPDAHVEDERAGKARQRLPVDRGLVLGRVLVAGDEGDRARRRRGG